MYILQFLNQNKYVRGWILGYLGSFCSFTCFVTCTIEFNPQFVIDVAFFIGVLISIRQFLYAFISRNMSLLIFVVIEKP